MQQTTTPLVLAWLGTPLMRLAERPLTFQTRKAVALLVCLTVEAGSHSREKLTTLFWPEERSAPRAGDVAHDPGASASGAGPA